MPKRATKSAAKRVAKSAKRAAKGSAKRSKRSAKRTKSAKRGGAFGSEALAAAGVLLAARTAASYMKPKKSMPTPTSSFKKRPFRPIRGGGAINKITVDNVAEIKRQINEKLDTVTEESPMEIFDFVEFLSGPVDLAMIVKKSTDDMGVGDVPTEQSSTAMATGTEQSGGRRFPPYHRRPDDGECTLDKAFKRLLDEYYKFRNASTAPAGKAATAAPSVAKAATAPAAMAATAAAVKAATAMATKAATAAMATKAATAMATKAATAAMKTKTKTKTAPAAATAAMKTKTAPAAPTPTLWQNGGKKSRKSTRKSAAKKSKKSVKKSRKSAKKTKSARKSTRK